MTQHYDVIVVGGGHNGLTNAAYLAKAGKRVVVLERRHVLGGAAVTEEIIPGFLFSECSYVVSLLRPEIIRELDLPRHGLEILPLDGTFSPMPSGDYLWRMHDHAKSVRDTRLVSRLDAEAYDEFSKMMTPMCRFVKPMLSMVPPDPTTLNPKDLKQLHFMLQHEVKLLEIFRIQRGGIRRDHRKHRLHEAAHRRHHFREFVVGFGVETRMGGNFALGFGVIVYAPE